MTGSDHLARFLYDAGDLTSLLTFLVKGGLGKQARDEMAAATAKFVAANVRQSGIEASGALDAAARATTAALADNGWVSVPDVFTGAEIDEIQTFLADKPVHFTPLEAQPGEQRECRVADVPKNVGLAHYKEVDLCRCPLIYRVLHDASLIDVVSAYVGAPATISAVSLWWSFPNALAPDKNQPFHHDRDDFNVTKLFVYLTEVTATSGPHAYIPQTHSMAVLARFVAERLPREVADAATFWQWMEKFFKPDDEIARVFGAERVNVLTGPRGTSFLEDTRGLHRAVFPQAGRRLAFEVTFTVLPKYNESHMPVPRRELAFADGGAIPPRVRYATRLLYT